MAWTETFDSTFFLAVGSLVISALALTAKYCLKSKCEHFTICYGLLKIDRRVDLETQVDLQQMESNEATQGSEKVNEDK
jgi:hypothetical protein